MNWLLPRLAAGVLAMLAGGVAGFLVSNVEHTLLWRVLGGGALGVALGALVVVWVASSTTPPRRRFICISTRA